MNSHSHIHSHTHIRTHTLKWVNWWWTGARSSFVMCTVTNLVNTVLSLTHINLITEWCWAQGSAWGQTGLNTHWRTFSLIQKLKNSIRIGIKTGIDRSEVDQITSKPPSTTCQSGGITGYYGYKTSWKYSSFIQLLNTELLWLPVIWALPHRVIFTCAIWHPPPLKSI